uniref:Uncharacterized protein n=1 Tax=Ananas comosus var. bracteatus TaxID=296719 RepID=A0A6V7Q7I4_ANACO|nr:unnamed protein product [Ananas comosus var. bracteatus]
MSVDSCVDFRPDDAGGSIREQRMWRCLSILSSSGTALSRFRELLSLSPDSCATYFALIHKMRYNCMCNSECFTSLYIFAAFDKCNMIKISSVLQKCSDVDFKNAQKAPKNQGPERSRQVQPTHRRKGPELQVSVSKTRSTYDRMRMILTLIYAPTVYNDRQPRSSSRYVAVSYCQNVLQRVEDYSAVSATYNRLTIECRFGEVGWIWDRTKFDPRYVSSLDIQWNDISKALENLHPAKGKLEIGLLNFNFTEFGH